MPSATACQAFQTPTLLIRSREPQLFSHEEFLNLKQQLPYVRAHSLPTSDPLHEHHSNIVINSILDFLSPITSPSSTIPAKAGIHLPSYPLSRPGRGLG